jgi:hypothetical protein
LNPTNRSPSCFEFKTNQSYDFDLSPTIVWIGLHLVATKFFNESREAPEKTREIRVKSAGKLYLFHFRFTTSGDVTSDHLISGDVISGDVPAPPQMLFELC